MLQPALISLALYGALLAVFGLALLPYLLLTAFWGAFQLTSANYLEHYGLLRRKLDNGRYEICQPQHSWNSNHLFSNWALFHLQRHSDHHAHPTRRYQSLRNFPDLPRLPSGYFGMYLLAYCPPLWFRVMNPRLLAAVHGDATRINFQPGKREQLMQRYGLQESAA
ncbi:Alkane 1-monooxygenase 1 [compost metagenome]